MDRDRLQPLGFSKFLSAEFRGPVKYKCHPDRVVAIGDCLNCGGTVGQVLKIHEDLLAEYHAPKGQIKVAHQAVDMVRKKHQCPIAFDGRTTVEDFLKGLKS